MKFVGSGLVLLNFQKTRNRSTFIKKKSKTLEHALVITCHMTNL